MRRRMSLVAPLAAAALAACSSTPGANVPLTVSIVGSGTVAANPGTLSCNATSCAGEVPANAAVTLVAVPDAGGYFYGWGGACVGTLLTCTIFPSGLTLVRASFSQGVTSGVSVIVNPFSLTVAAGHQQQFAALVTGTADKAVTWSVAGAGGSIDASGLYTAPAASGGRDIVTAVSVADPSKSGAAQVTVYLPPVTVTISPEAVTVPAPGTQQFVATVSGAKNTAVTWRMAPGSAGNASIDSNGLYTAAGFIGGPVQVVATSVADLYASATATITIPPKLIAVTPASITLAQGAHATFSAAVSGFADPSVTWSAQAGTIDQSGNYTAPYAPGSIVVAARAVEDPVHQFASATVTVPPLQIAIAPRALTLAPGAQRQLQATVTGAVDTSVIWRVATSGGGTITADGLYTAPAALGAYQVEAGSPHAPNATPAVATMYVVPPQSATYQVGPGHSGRAQLAGSLSFPNAPTWTATLPGGCSYPLIADGKVFVTSLGIRTGSGTQLFAFDAQTGEASWGPADLPDDPRGDPANSLSYLAAEGGNVFTVSDNNFTGIVRSFQSATGKIGWTTALSTFGSIPTASYGLLYLATDNRDSLALDQATGDTVWTYRSRAGESGPLAVADDGVFAAATGVVFRVDAFTGAPLWVWGGNVSGGRPAIPVYGNGRLYAESWPDQVFDGPTGAVLGPFDTNALPALGAQLAYFPRALGANEVIDAVDASGTVVYTAAPDPGELLPLPPLEVNGSLVFVSSAGKLYAVDGTGRQIAKLDLGGALPSPLSFLNPYGTTIAVGEGMIVVPMGNRLVGVQVARSGR